MQLKMFYHFQGIASSRFTAKADKLLPDVNGAYNVLCSFWRTDDTEFDALPLYYFRSSFALFFCTFTFSHLADAFIQSDSQLGST